MGKRFKAIGAGMLLAMVVQEIPAADIEHGRLDVHLHGEVE